MARTSLQQAIDEVAARDPVLAGLVARVGPVRHWPRDPEGPFAALVRSIVYQQVAGAAARTIYGRVHTAVGQPLTQPLGAGALFVLRSKKSRDRAMRLTRAAPRFPSVSDEEG
jgi:3-methyladenine DNA glycosylase/8-oxoguanine DNA glycosylase